MLELENQRYGKNKETKINRAYLKSGEYRNKFNQISDNLKLNRLLYKLAKTMLEHRTGTKLEDMYWIDLDHMKVIASETDMQAEKQIIYSETTKGRIKEYKNLLTIHTHPDSFPPSIEDLNSNYDHNYTLGVVVCHDGSLYIYSANERINENYYKLIVEAYLKIGYNEKEAQIKALNELQENFDIRFKEVTGNDSI